ncbi:hypothetical protein [Prosthecomicrobium pneumaticum]|uniref:Uncharacterized protein n=1 Tax=Prosthecomicrobium pneumaticum TaxID=81895 RepID=A0A7W9L1P3_9HYPH|nr:hypothetical protein [Prosthecomicrobium pneumaticum]MBB5752858.1 hypothetical protein [Prosthecomicrobium pneumaticum]
MSEQTFREVYGHHHPDSLRNAAARITRKRLGGPTHLTFPAMPELIAIPAASLDDPSRFHPAALTYAIRGEAWDPIDETLPRFERMPGG